MLIGLDFYAHWGKGGYCGRWQRQGCEGALPARRCFSCAYGQTTTLPGQLGAQRVWGSDACFAAKIYFAI